MFVTEMQIVLSLPQWYFLLKTPSVARSVVKSSLHGPPFAVCCQYLGVPPYGRKI